MPGWHSLVAAELPFLMRLEAGMSLRLPVRPSLTPLARGPLRAAGRTDSIMLPGPRTGTPPVRTERAADHYRRAVKWYVRGTRKLAEYREAVRLDPGNRDYRYAWACC
jgi:hypothetical protein